MLAASKAEGNTSHLHHSPPAVRSHAAQTEGEVAKAFGLVFFVCLSFFLSTKDTKDPPWICLKSGGGIAIIYNDVLVPISLY